MTPRAFGRMASYCYGTAARKIIPEQGGSGCMAENELSVLISRWLLLPVNLPCRVLFGPDVLTSDGLRGVAIVWERGGCTPLICLGSVSRKTQEAKQGVTVACSFSLIYFPTTLLPLRLFTLLEFS